MGYMRVLEKSPRSLTLEKENSSSEDPKFVQTEVKKFEYLMQKDIKLALEELAETYPQLVTFENSQERYGLPTAGRSTDCPFDDDVVGCKNYFITIEDKMSLDDRSAIPDVFLSGAVHGNERIGPTKRAMKWSWLKNVGKAYQHEEYFRGLGVGLRV
eukprot:CAMPEP_0116075970 /NCGR_PEP_ID=MMETSP0322-20121206/16967_1 /TAXON_ID=163516 /ORGANISM="Leptocylindrus danicus var. apora, Strain B651" /LENGTH=156 /DNA_ID=CAMNT_0003566161 /DNA_START=93 /DNA_END=563 /DNA_ORIENTATION=+